MKKSLVLAMAMALGVTASAYAANPFVDVPAGHWAYDSINKLAAAGIVDGYGDNTFGGDRLMTRYEMAQIVAKAMAKGANVDRLAAEFADELDSLGVRVAALEKKSDNVKITGEARFRYADHDAKFMGQKAHVFDADLRSRIWLTGQVNEDWKYTGMIENIQDFSNNSGDEETRFRRAYVEGKLGGMTVTAGRYNMFIANGNIYDEVVDGVEVNYGDKVNLKLVAGKGATGTTTAWGQETDTIVNRYAGGELGAVFGTATATAGYYNLRGCSGVEGVNSAIWFLGAGTTFGDFGLNAMYLRGDTSISGWNDDAGKDGWTVGATYKGADAAQPGTYGIFANYYNQGRQTYLAHTTDANSFLGYGFKGYGVGVDYTVAKNMVARVAYYDTEAKDYGYGMDFEGLGDTKDKIIWTDLTITF